MALCSALEQLRGDSEEAKDKKRKQEAWQDAYIFWCKGTLKNTQSRSVDFLRKEFPPYATAQYLTHVSK